MKKLLVSILSALLLCALASAQWGATSKPIRWRTILTGTSSAVEQLRTYVIFTENDFQQYWVRSMGRGASASSAPRGIDWQKECVLAVHLGTRDAGSSVYVESVAAPRQGEIVVTYVDQRPPQRPPRDHDRDRDRGGVAAKSSPFVIVAMERTAGNPKFVRRDGTARPPVWGGHPRGCGGIYCTCGIPGYYGCPCGCPYCLAYAYPVVVPYTILFSGDNCGISVPRTFFIGTRIEWLNYQRECFGDQADRGNIPEIDWSREYLAVIHLGQRASAGYGVVLDGIKASSPGETVISYYESQPKPGTLNAQRITSPYLVVRLPRQPGVTKFYKLPGPPIR